ncbi:hypothetical protein HJG60_009966 [Phyllostomus discolor]|uniref:Uncharacterized protein n=1 Tax=Phyllostomus discolor TaxID=89673 RepID=A0A834BAI5_9CHIR|nr:hypothetical protein HJG60_009966 [Phyllostomus discolor]
MFVWIQSFHLVTCRFFESSAGNACKCVHSGHFLQLLLILIYASFDVDFKIIITMVVATPSVFVGGRKYLLINVRMMFFGFFLTMVDSLYHRQFTFKKYILLIMLLQLSQFSPSAPLRLVSPLLSSCPCVMHVSSLASPFPVLFLTSPYFVPSNLCFLILVPFPPFSPFLLPVDNPPNDLQIYDSVSVVLVCLAYSFDSIMDSCEFIAILMFLILISFFLYSL